MGHTSNCTKTDKSTGLQKEQTGLLRGSWLSPQITCPMCEGVGCYICEGKGIVKNNYTHNED